MGLSTALEQGVDRIVARALGDSQGSTRSPATGSPQSGAVLRIVDLGGGTGGQAVRLAASGHDVTVVDPSPDALGVVSRRASEQPPAGSLTAVQGDAESLDDLLPARSADLVVCHGVLEFVDDPRAALTSIHRVLQPAGNLSLAVAQRNGAVLQRVVNGQLGQARTIATSPDGRWGEDDPMRRRFDAATIQDLLSRCGFDVVAVRGLRALSEIHPKGAEVDTAILAELDAYAAEQPALLEVAPVLHIHARRG